ncbi:MAG: hypothetical protein SGBAC_006995 [Bacillariaceae sp.]
MKVISLFLLTCTLALASADAKAVSHWKGSVERDTKGRLHRNLEKTGKIAQGGKEKGTKMPAAIATMNPTVMLPTTTPGSAPTASSKPSASLVPSSAPSLSGAPSEAPSVSPSAKPSVSQMPSTSRVPSLVPSESMQPTCIDNVGKRGGGKGSGGKEGKGKNICVSASPSQAPSKSQSPSSSAKPSTSPSTSNAPSLSSAPSYLPSSSSRPSSMPTCGKGKGCSTTATFVTKAPKKRNTGSKGSPPSDSSLENPLSSDAKSSEAIGASSGSRLATIVSMASACSLLLLCTF